MEIRQNRENLKQRFRDILPSITIRIDMSTLVYVSARLLGWMGSVFYTWLFTSHIAFIIFVSKKISRNVLKVWWLLL